MSSNGNGLGRRSRLVTGCATVIALFAIVGFAAVVILIWTGVAG